MTRLVDGAQIGGRLNDSPVDSGRERLETAVDDESGPSTSPSGSETATDEAGSGTGDNGISRRNLLKASVLAAILGGGGYAVWQGLEDGGGEEAVPNLPFEVWKEVREVLQTSPTHLPARAEQLVEEGDTEGAYNLVKEDIVTLPGALHKMGEDRRVVRWGARTTLRSGAGTQREQAELLASLYEDMGYDTQLRVASEPLSEADIKDLLYDPPDLVFDPDVDVETAEDWLDRLDTEPVDEATVRVDADGEASAALGKAILAPLEPLSESDLNSWTFEYGGGENPLVVEATDGEETIYADLFSRDAAFDDPVGSPSAMAEPPDRIDPGTIAMTLSGREARTGNVVEFVSGEWPAEVVAGRQVRVQTLPSPDPIDIPLTRCIDVNEFHPALTLQGRNLSDEEATAHSVLGDGITRTGDRIAFDGETLTRNGTPTVSETDQTDPGAVDSLAVAALAEQFPRVRLELHPRDTAGERIGPPPG
jgi:hypothetical protein